MATTELDKLLDRIVSTYPHRDMTPDNIRYMSRLIIHVIKEMWQMPNGEIDKL